MKYIIIPTLLIVLTFCLMYCYSYLECNDISLSDNNFNGHNQNQLSKNTNVNSTPEKLDFIVRMGPVLLKFDKEWLVEMDKKKVLRIGMSLRNFEDEELNVDYDIISPSSKSVNRTRLMLKPETNGLKKNIRDVDVYDIECADTKMWIDFNILFANRHNADDDTNSYSFSIAKDVYFYHPTRKKWWGIHFEKPNYLGGMMYEEIYKDSNTATKVNELFYKTFTEKTTETIVNKRTFILPSIKFYEDKFGDLLEKHNMFCWYVEKEEPEKIDPKNEEEETHKSNT